MVKIGDNGPINKDNALHIRSPINIFNTNFNINFITLDFTKM